MQTKRVIVTGSTGMVGKGVLLECLEDPIIEKVLVSASPTSQIMIGGRIYFL